MEKTFEEQSRGNVANILNFYYENKLDVPKELINIIDFTEEFEKRFDFKFSKSKREEDVKVQETHIINCLKNLDYKVYEKYMNIDWIYHEGLRGDSRFIRTALYYNKTEVLNRSLELVEKELENYDLVSDLGNRDLERSFFKDALNLTTILNMHLDSKSNEENLLFKYDFFKKSLKLFNRYYDIRAKIWKSEQQIDFEDWHKNMDKMKVFFSSQFHGQNELNEILISNKKFFPILKDAFLQYKESDLDPLGKPLNPFGNHMLLKMGMKYGNINYLNLAMKNNKNEKVMSFTFNSFLEEKLNSFTDVFMKSNWNSTIAFPNIKNIKSVYECLIKNNIDVQFDNIGALTVLSADSKESFKLLEKIPNINREQIKDGLSIDQLSYLNVLIPKARENNTEPKIFLSEKEMFTDMFPTFEMYLMSKAYEFTPNPKLTLEEKKEAVNIAIENSYNYFNLEMSKEKASILLSTVLLDEELPTKEDKKVTKIKI